MFRPPRLDGAITAQPDGFILAGRLFLFGLCFLFVGCSGGTSANWFKNGLLDPTQVGNFEKSVSNEIRGSISILEEPEGIQNAEEPSAEDIEPRFDERRIGPGDVLNVSVFELLLPNVATSLQLRVGNSGFETFPVVGQVRVNGLTARELELALKEKIRDAGVLDDADVQASIIQSPSDQFSVVGFIARPNLYQLPRPDYRLLEGIAAAGGVPQYAEKIYVFRNEPRLWTTRGPASGAPATHAGADAAEPVPAPYAMSETSGGRAASASKVRQEDPTPPPATEEVVDELDILEGRPTSKPTILPRWDAERGEWVLEQATTQAVPATAKTEAGTQAPATLPVEQVQDLAAATAAATQGTTPTIESEATTAAATSGPDEAETEGQVWEEATRELAVPLRIIEIPVKELLDGDPRYNIFIRPGDTINVPEGFVGEYYLGGNVARPGAYNLTGRRVTVKQAIVSAGGFGALAWPSRAEVVRRVGKDEEQVIQLDLDAIFAGKAPDFYVKPNDIVNVGTTAVAPFMAVLRNAFRFSYGMGFVYDRNFGDSDTFQAKEQVKNRHLQEALQRGLPTS